MILVTGATGQVGRHVARGLRAAGHRVRAFVRDAERAYALLGDGIDFAIGDFTDDASVRRALSGADTVFLACTNRPDQYELETRAIDVAVASGAQRVIKLSAIGASVGSPLAFWDMHGRIEEHLRRTSLRSVVLRPGGYMSVVLRSARTVREQQALFAPLAGGHSAMIDPRDVAEVAIAALTSCKHDGRTHAITGPESIGYDQIAAEISAVTGRAVAFVPVSDEAAREAMLSDGLPPWLVEQVITMSGLVRAGAVAQVTDTFRAVTGHEPRTLGAFVREHAAAFMPA